MQKDCPSQWAYIATEDGYISTSDIEDEEEKENDDGEEEILGGEDTVTYRSAIVQRVLNTQVQQPDQLQHHNLFQIFFVINNRCVRVIIDGGSCNNLVSSELVKKLGLTTRPHQHPYHIQWLNDSGKAKVTQTCRVLFPLGHIQIRLIVMWYLCKLVHFCWVDLGNMIMMQHTMVEVTNTPLCIKERNILCYL